MDDKHRPAFAHFLFVYKVFFSSLLVASIVVTIWLALTRQFAEPAERCTALWCSVCVYG